MTTARWGVTEYDLSAHIDELVYEEESALKHLLMDEYATLSLSGCDEEDAQEVWRQPRPWSICYGQDRAVHKGVDLIAVGVAGGWKRSSPCSSIVIPRRRKACGIMPRSGMLTLVMRSSEFVMLPYR